MDWIQLPFDGPVSCSVNKLTTFCFRNMRSFPDQVDILLRNSVPLMDYLTLRNLWCSRWWKI